MGELMMTIEQTLVRVQNENEGHKRLLMEQRELMLANAERAGYGSMYHYGTVMGHMTCPMTHN